MSGLVALVSVEISDHFQVGIKKVVPVAVSEVAPIPDACAVNVIEGHPRGD